MRLVNLEVMANPFNWLIVTFVLVLAGLTYDILRSGLAPPVPANQ